MKLKLLVTALGIGATLLGAYKDEPADRIEYLQGKLDATKEIRQQIETITQTRYVEIPNDAAKWYLIICRHTVPTAMDAHLLRLFRKDERLAALWNHPSLNVLEVWPGMRGFADQSYADLPPHSVLLMDGTGERIFLRRGQNVPAGASQMIRDINADIQAYHKRHQPETPAAADLGPVGEDTVSGRLRPILRWPFVAVRWIFTGRRPCPNVPAPAPVDVPLPAPEPVVPLTEIPDTGAEQSSPWRQRIVAGLMAALGMLVYQVRKEI